MPIKLPLATLSATNIRSLLPTSASGCTIIYASHARWPLPRQTDRSVTSIERPLQVSVVDSSFNPPHAAHLALAQHGHHDAVLLALTIANPDKGSIDPESVANRLEMMRAVARDLERRSAQEPDGRPEWANVAVAVLQAPTFTEKSEMLRRDLDALAQTQADDSDASVRLTFGVGYDTLIRIFAPRYYQPPNPDLHTSMTDLLTRDDSRIACARRGDVSPEEEHQFLTSKPVREWAERGKIDLFDIPDPTVQGISSTAIRAAASEKRWDDVSRSIPIPEVVEIIRSKRLYQVQAN
ncbi:hypothetical protein JCM3774_006332 [Rhodotorula dairenensis]